MKTRPTTRRDVPLRIGFLIGSTRSGGAEEVVVEWALEVARRGHESFLYTFQPATRPAEIPACVRHTHRSFETRLGRWLALPRWIRRRADADSLDVLVSALTHPNLTALLGLKLLRPSRVPLVISEHSLPSVLLPIDRPGVHAKLWLLRRMYRRADAAVAVSHAVATDLVSRFRVAPDRTSVVPNPVLELKDESSAELPERLHVVFVGRLVPQKAPHLFIDTLARLADLGIAVEGTVVGDGPLRDALAEQARHAQLAVRFTGWVPRWQEEVDGCDCLLLPSDVEGFGNVLVEAAAAGVPSVVRSSALGVADAVIPGVTGELMSSGSPEALATGVLRAIRTRPDDAIRMWLARFTPESSGDALLTVIARVTGQTPPVDAGGLTRRTPLGLGTA